MPKSKSKSSARAARSQGFAAHPALAKPAPMIALRMGSEEPVRLPDNYTELTSATVLKSDYTITSDGAGHAVWMEYPVLSSALKTWTVTGGVASAAATDTPHGQNTKFQGSARYARMNHMRVQITYIGADQTAAGYLSYAVKSSQADVNSISIDGLHTGAVKQVRATQGFVVDVGYHQEPRFEFAAVSTFMTETFRYPTFVASGLPFNTAVFRVRVLRFMEFIPVEGDLFEGEQAVEPGDPATLHVHGQMSAPALSVRAHGDNSHFNMLKQFANAAYHAVQPVAGQYVAQRAIGYMRSALTAAAPLMIAAA